MSFTDGFLKLFRYPRSSSAFVHQQDFTYYKVTLDSLSTRDTIRSGVFEFDGFRFLPRDAL